MPLILVVMHQPTHDVLVHYQCADRHCYPHANARILYQQGLIVLPRPAEPTNHRQLSQSNNLAGY
jgi:hypothetical protein